MREHGRMDAARELAQLLQRLASCSLAVVTSASAEEGSRRMPAWIRRSCSASATSRCCAPSCRLRSSRRRSASPAATIRCRDACSSASRACDLGVQVLVLQRDGGGGADGLDELGILVERRVVDERGDLAAVALDGGDRAVAAVGRQDDRVAVAVDVRVPLREPVGHHERRIAERPRQRVLERAAAHRPQVAEQLRQAGARQP